MLASVAEITLQVSTLYYLNRVQLFKGIHSFLVAHVPLGTHLQQLQGGPQLCAALCRAMCASANATERC